MNPWLIFGLFLIQAATNLAILDAMKPPAAEPPPVVELKPPAFVGEQTAAANVSLCECGDRCVCNKSFPCLRAGCSHCQRRLCQPAGE